MRELASDFESDPSAEAMARETIGTALLHSADQVDHTPGNLLHGCIRRSFSIQAPIPHARVVKEPDLF